jgi:hypothetical protein
LPMIELVNEAGKDTETEKYITLPLDGPRGLFAVFKRGDPPKIYRIRNSKHPRGLAERRKLTLTLRDMSSSLTLALEIGYRATCPAGNEAKVAQLLSGDTTPGETLDQMVEGWVNDFAKDTPAFLEQAGKYADAMTRRVEASGQERGLGLKVFLEGVQATHRRLAFSLPVSFRDQTEEVSVSFRVAIFSSKDEAAIQRARLNEAPPAIEQELKRRIQNWFGAAVLRDAVERQTRVVADNLKIQLNLWLTPFGLESVVEAIDPPPRPQPDVMHTVRVDGIVSLGHFQWQVRTIIEIADPDKFLRQKKERQISEIHVWLGEQYPEFCWDSVTKAGGDASRFYENFQLVVGSAVDAIGYRLVNLILRRVLSEVELDARKQQLDANLAQDKFLSQLVEGTQAKILNAYDADEDSEQIQRLEQRLLDLQGKKRALIKEIAIARSDARNLLPAATADAIGAERRSWTAIADGGAEMHQIEAPKKRGAAAGNEDAPAAGE